MKENQLSNGEQNFATETTESPRPASSELKADPSPEDRNAAYAALFSQLGKWQRRARAFQEAYKEKSFEVFALDIQLLDVRAYGVDVVTARNNKALKDKLMTACVERNDLRRLVELARDHVWEPENWESYERCKGTNSFSLPVEWFELCEAIEERYGAMPLDEPCECGAKTVADHKPDCNEKPDWEADEDQLDSRATRCEAVVEAAVAWHQSGQEGDNTWIDKAEALGQAIDRLLEMRTAPTNGTKPQTSEPEAGKDLSNE